LVQHILLLPMSRPYRDDYSWCFDLAAASRAASFAQLRGVVLEGANCHTGHQS
jgi:hypothetical protein